MRNLISIFIVIILMVNVINIYAKQEIPNSPVGVRLQQLLLAIESDEHESFITDNFSLDFINLFPMEDHLSFFSQVKQMHGGFEVVSIEIEDDFQLSAIVKSNKMEAWKRIDLTVEQTKPYKIDGLGLDMAQQPANIPYAGPKHDLVSKIQPDTKAIRSGAVANNIDKHLTHMEERGFSGAVLVAKEGAIILSKGYGYANSENKIPYHTQSAFDIGSITKQFTGAAILKLEMMGILSTNDLITTYFENVPKDKSSITLHHLLTHSAGFTQALGFDYNTISRDDFIKLAFSSELEFIPGDHYQYSNVGYSLLAAIIEIVTNDSYEKFLHDNLFIPAGMNYTGYLLPEWEKDQVVHGYLGEEYFGQPHKKNWAVDGPWWHLRGNGGIISTINDMYKWHLALKENKILSAEAKEKYFAPHISESPNSGTHYGYGWVIANSSRGTLVYMHNGGNPYFANECYRYIEDDVFVYITSNNGEMSAIEQSGIILRMIFD